jgi:hypothetical protein
MAARQTRECTTCASWCCNRCRRIRRVTFELMNTAEHVLMRNYPQCNYCLSTSGRIIPVRHQQKKWFEHNPGRDWPELLVCDTIEREREVNDDESRKPERCRC